MLIHKSKDRRIKSFDPHKKENIKISTNGQSLRWSKKKLSQIPLVRSMLKQMKKLRLTV